MRIIPITCEDVSEKYPGNTVHNRLVFVIPSLGTEYSIDFVASRTRAAIKRLMALIELERAGAGKEEIVSKLEALVKPSKGGSVRTLSDNELEEFKRANGWIEAPVSIDDLPDDDLITPTELEVSLSTPLPGESATRDGESLEEQFDRCIGARQSAITSDDRYVVDRVARTVTPVEAIPGSIADLMPQWSVGENVVEFWPRTFDVENDCLLTFRMEEIAARIVLPEVAALMFDVPATRVQVNDLGTSAMIVDAPRLTTVGGA